MWVLMLMGYLKKVGRRWHQVYEGIGDACQNESIYRVVDANEII